MRASSPLYNVAKSFVDDVAVHTDGHGQWKKRVQTAAGMSERRWFHSSFRTLTDQITYLTLISLARVEIRQSVPKTAWERLVGAVGRSLHCPDIVGERGRRLHCPIRGEEEARRRLAAKTFVWWRRRRADESRLLAPSDQWMKKIFDCEGDGVKEDSY